MDERDDLPPDQRAIYRSVSRRGFMGATAAATLAALAGRAPVLRASRAAPKKTTADAVIVLWMAGGMAQTETFDPKRYTPFAPGVSASDVLSTFPAIDTAVDDIKLTAGLERIAGVIDRVRCSTEVGTLKAHHPDRFFGDILSEAGLSFSDALLLDDSARNCQRFRAFGGHAHRHREMDASVAALAAFAG